MTVIDRRKNPQARTLFSELFPAAAPGATTATASSTRIDKHSAFFIAHLVREKTYREHGS